MTSEFSLLEVLAFPPFFAWPWLVVGGGLSRIDLNSGEVSVVAFDLDLGVPAPPYGMPPTFFFNGVAVGPSGAIYVTGDVNNVLHRIWPR